MKQTLKSSKKSNTPLGRVLEERKAMEQFYLTRLKETHEEIGVLQKLPSEESKSEISDKE